MLADRAKARGESVVKAPKIKVDHKVSVPDPGSSAEVFAEYYWSQHKREEAITHMLKATRADPGNYELPGLRLHILSYVSSS